MLLYGNILGLRTMTIKKRKSYMAQNDIHGLLNLLKTGQIYLKNRFISETKGAIVLVFQKN